MKKNMSVLISLVILFSVVMSACAPAAPAVTQAPAASSATQAPAAPAATQAPAAQATTDTTTAAPAQPSGAIKRGGTLNWSTGAAPQNLDIWISEANQDMWSMVNVMEGLVRANRAGNDIEPALSDKWTISADGLEYTFHLRPGIKFSTGDAVTPEDVVFSLKYAMVTGPWKWLDSSMKDVVKVDDQNVKVILTSKYTPMMTVFGFISNSVVPQKLFNSMGLEAFDKMPVGTGPYMIKEYVPNEHITLVRNPYYWDMGEDGKPLPYIDTVIVTQVPEATTRVMQVQSGSADGIDGVPWSSVNQLKTDPTGDMMLWPSTQSHYLLFNFRIPPMDDLKFRQALGYATDRKAMVDTVLFGNGSVAKSFFPEDGMCVDKTIPDPVYDLEKAKALLKESKYPTGYKGFKIEVPQGSTIGRDNATMLKDMWAKIGVEVDVQEVEGGTMSDEFNANKHYAISGYQWTNDILDPDEQVGFFVIDPAYHTGWVNDKAVADAKEAQVILDPAKRCQLYSDIQKIYNDEVPVLSLYHTPFNTFTKKDVKGFTMIPLGWYRFQYVWLDR